MAADPRITNAAASAAADAVVVLNRILEADRTAVSELVRTRIRCNEKLADDPTVQVGKFSDVYQVGLLGVVNGLFGVDAKSWGAIAAVVENPESGDHTVLRFEVREKAGPEKEGAA